MTARESARAFPLDELREHLDPSRELPFVPFHTDDHVTGVLYRSRQPDRQRPHEQDELYFVARGSATLATEGGRRTLKAGDAAYVPAGAEHAFEERSTDFACWAVFFGPQR